VQYQLRPFTKEQTGCYIDIQMKQAGGPEDVFDVSVKELIHDFTGGVARQINNLATACLLQASACNAIRVDDTIFRHTTNEFHV